MPGSEDRDGSNLSSGRSVRLTASSQEGQGNDRLADNDATAPPLGVKLTRYRLLNMTTMFSFCVIKGILTYKGQSIAPTTLDWVSGGVLAVVLYWIGLYEQRDAKKWEWFFHFDLAPAIGNFVQLVVGGVLFVLFSHDGLFAATLLSCSITGPLGYLAAYLFMLLARSEKATRLNPTFLGVVLGILFSFGIIFLSEGVAVLIRRVRVRVRRWHAMRFVDDHGPTLAQRYERFGALGRIVMLFLLFALYVLPFAVFIFSLLYDTLSRDP